MRSRLGSGVRLTLVLLALLIVPALTLMPGAALASEGRGGLVNLDKSLIIQMVNFLLLLFILWKLLYKPFVAKMNERSEAIKKSLEEAQAARAEAQKQREEHAGKIQQAYAEAQAIRAAALKEAADEQHRLVEGARAEAARLTESARNEMAQDIRRARQELRQEVADLSIAVAEKLIRKSLTDADHRKIVQDALTGLERKN
jgi:F-type H+-transporting ATPase subunit b